jgi:MFS family permease
MPTSRFTRNHSLRALAYPDFRLLLCETMLNGFLQPVHYLSTIFWVQDHYPGQSVVFVGLVAFMRGLGLLSFSFIGGAIADRFPRRRVLLVCECIAAANVLFMALAMLAEPLGDSTIILVYASSFVLAAVMGVDLPTRAASLADITGRQDVANAISLNAVGQQVAIPFIFPLLGFLNSTFDAGRVFLGSLAVYAGMIPLLLLLRYGSTHEERRRNMFQNIRDGLSYASRDSTIFGVVAVVMVMNVVGMPGVGTLGPVWFSEVLGVNKTQFGLIAVGWPLGSIAASVIFSWRHNLAGRGAGLCLSGLVFAVAAVVISHSRITGLSAAMFFACGFGMMGAIVTASTIVQHVVAEGMRGRVMALFPLAQGISLLNAFPVSLVGQALGLEVVVPVFSWTALILTLALVLGRPKLRRLRSSASPMHPVSVPTG